MPPTPSDPRTVLARLAAERGHDLATLSRVIGRNKAYIQQFVKRGTPRRLTEEDRGTLARFLGVAESLLGGRPDADADAGAQPGVPWLAARPSAGPGSLDSEDRALGELGLPAAYLRTIGGQPGQVSAVTVRGDSMAPTLADGDLILVDHGAAGRPLSDGIHVLRQDGTLIVKRLAREVGGRWSVASDNPHVPDQTGVAPAALSIVGRVLWFGRTLD